MFLVFIVTSILARVLQSSITNFFKKIYKNIKNILSVLSLIAISDPMLLGLAAKSYLLSLDLVVKKSKNYQV